MPAYHEQAGKIKDLSAGAVLLAACAAVAAGLAVFGPKLIALFG
jgi:diacylglycerol kinase